jgi:fucose 4-O-acetylase-like acetyltransferase
MSNKRNELMPLMSIVGILLVVLGHSGYAGTNIGEDCPNLCKWIYNFHMPLFFFISGFLFSLTNTSFLEMDKKRLIGKKVYRLLVPYIVIGVLLFAVKFVFSSFASVERSFSLGAFLKMFVAPSAEGSTMGYLWYLITLFMIFFVMALLALARIDLKKPLWCLGTIVASWALLQLVGRIEWLNFGQVLWYMPFFLLGIVYKRYDTAVHRTLIGGGILNVLCSVALSVGLVYAPVDSLSFAYRVAAALVGIWMTLSLCSVLGRNSFVKDRILPFSRYTYSIYLLSWFGQYATKIVVVNILHLNAFVCIPLLFVMGVAVPLVIDKAVDKIDSNRKCRWMRLVIGY